MTAGRVCSIRSALALAALLLPWTGRSAEMRTDVLLDDCADVAGWTVNPGREFPGASGQVEAATDERGRPCVRGRFDMREGGRYCGIEKTLTITRAGEISFRIRAEGASSGMVRLRDVTNQEHAAGFKITGTDWQRVSLRLDRATFGGFWSGANDGEFHFPVRRVLIAMHPTGEKRGQFLLRDLAVTTDRADLYWRVAVTTPRPGGISFVDEGDVPIRLAVRKCTSGTLEAEVSWRIVDVPGNLVGEGRRRVRFGRWEEWSQGISLPAPRPGYYGVDLSVRTGDKALATGSGGIGVVRRLLNFGKDDARSFFGIHGGGPAAERIGVKWTRISRTWWWGEGREGHFYWPDEQIERARDNHIRIMLNLHYGPPGWAKERAGDRPLWPPGEELLTGWAKYVRACVERYRGVVAAFEIQNEPDLTCWHHLDVGMEQGVAGYVDICRTAYAEIKRLAPDIPIAGVGVSGGGYRNNLRFSRAVLDRIGGLFDIYAGHPYASPRYFGPRLLPLFPYANRLVDKLELSKAMLAEYGGEKRVWIGEKGWGLDIREPLAGPHSLAYARCVARALITGRSVPGIERWFWFLETGCNERGYEYGLWRGNPGQPLPAAVAYATSARFLYHVTPIRRLELPAPLRAYAFACPELSRAVVAVWSTADEEVLAPDWPPDIRRYGLFGREQDPRAPLVVGGDPTYLTVPAADTDRLLTCIEGSRVRPRQPIRLQALHLSALDRLEVRGTNRLDASVTVRVTMGGTETAAEVPANAPFDLIHGLTAPIVPGAGAGVPVTLRAGGVSVFTGTVSRALSACPLYAEIEVDGDLGEWGPPAARIEDRAAVLPPDPNVGWHGPEDLSLQIWWGWDTEHLRVAVRVRDDVHATPKTGAGGFWQSDSLQLAFDTRNDAMGTDEFGEDDIELGCVFAKGKARVFMTAPESRPLSVPCAARREGSTTIYELGIPWDLLGITPRPGRILAFNLIANDNDGHGREYWMGLTPGIGEAKRPAAYRDLYLRGK